MAQELLERGKRAWKTPASFAFSLAGAIWTLKTGDPVGAVLALASAGLGAAANSKPEVGAYSYLFKARERYA